MKSKFFSLISAAVLAGLLGVAPVRGTWQDVPGNVALTGNAVVRAVSGGLPAGGGSLALAVEVRNVEDLGAVTVVAGYDPDLLRVSGCQRGSHLDVGLCNTAYDSDDDGRADAVRFNGAALAGVSTADAPLTLAIITYAPLSSPIAGTDTPLSLNVLTFTDQNGVPMSFRAENGRIIFQAAVTPGHIQTLAARLGQPASSADLYDLVPDDTIDLFDLIALAGRWPGVWPP